MIYTVSDWPNVPFEGANYYNINKKQLGVFSNGSWKYYNPFNVKLPVDSYDVDSDSIPDEFDPEVIFNYTGPQPYINENGYSLPVVDYLSSINASSLNNSQTVSQKVANADGLIFYSDGSIRIFYTGHRISIEPGSAVFYGTIKDANGNGIPDLHDFDSGYTGSGAYADTTINPSTLLTSLQGNGSKNTSGKNISISLNGDGILINPNGEFQFFQSGDELNFCNNCAIFIGLYADSDLDGIPDSVDTNSNYSGNGDYMCAGVNPSLFLTNIDSGSSNFSGTSYSMQTSKDSLVINEVTCDIGFYPPNTTITIYNNETIFTGDFIDSDSDSLPNPVDTSANYSTGDFLSTGINPSLILNNIDEGSTNNIGRKYTTVTRRSGLIISNTGNVSIFQKGDTITVTPLSTVFFGTIEDANGDGLPDQVTSLIGYTQDPFVTTNNAQVNLQDFVSKPFSLTQNSGGFPIQMGPFEKPVYLIGPGGEITFMPPGEVFIWQPQWVICQPELTSTDSSQSFYSFDPDTLSINIEPNGVKHDSYAVRYFLEEDPETLRITDVPQILPPDTLNLFESTDGENIHLSD